MCVHCHERDSESDSDPWLATPHPCEYRVTPRILTNGEQDYAEPVGLRMLLGNRYICTVSPE